MKRSMMAYLAGLAIVLTLAVQASAQAPLAGPVQAPLKSPDAAKPGMVLADVVKLTATVEKIDPSNRTVTLKSAGGRSTTLKVDKAVKNFDQVRVGDKLAAEYIDAVAVFVRKAGTPPSVSETAAVELAPKGKKPAGIAVETTEVTAAVENKIGDELVIRHTEALAIAVMKPAS